MKKILGAKNFVQLDDNVSFQILRTNPVLTTNVKLMYDGEGMYLESYDANSLLTTTTYKHQRVYPNGLFNMDLKNFWASTVDDSMYHVHHKMSDTKICTNPDNMYENMYWCGVEPVISKNYDDEYGCIAPLYLKDKLPSYFVIFKVDEDKEIDPHKFTSIVSDNSSGIPTFDKNGATGDTSLVFNNGFISDEETSNINTLAYDIKNILGVDLSRAVKDEKSNKGKYSQIYHMWMTESSAAKQLGVNLASLMNGGERETLAYQRRINAYTHFEDSINCRFTKRFKNDMKIKKKISQKEKLLHVTMSRFCNVIRNCIRVCAASNITLDNFNDINVFTSNSIDTTPYVNKYGFDPNKQMSNLIINSIYLLIDICVLKDKLFKRDLDIHGPIAHYAYHCYVNKLPLEDRIAYYNKNIKKIHSWKKKQYKGIFNIVKECESTIKYYSINPQINVLNRSITIPYDAVSGLVKNVYIANASTISITPFECDWIDSVLFNSVDKTIQFRTKTNAGNKKRRNGKIVIKAYSYNGLEAEETIFIYQEGDPGKEEESDEKPSISVVNKKVTIAADVTNWEIFGVVVHNYASSIVVETVKEDEWLISAKHNHEKSTLTIETEKNESYVDRKTTITLRIPGTEKTTIITLIQLAKEEDDSVDVTIDADNNLQIVGDGGAEILKKSTILKVFDLSEKSPLGQYIRNYINQDRFEFNKPLYANNGDYNLIYYGISRDTGELVNKTENFKNEFVENDTTITHMDDYYTMGFYRNRLYFPYIMNIEFLFSDETDNYKFCRYYGMYCNATDLYEVEYANKSDVTNFEDYEPIIIDSADQIKTLVESPEDRPDGDCRRVVDVQKVGNLNNVYFSDGDGIYYVKDRLNNLYELDKKKHLLYSYMYSNTAECFKMADILINRAFGDVYGFPKVGYVDLENPALTETYFNYLNPTDVFNEVDDDLMFGMDENQFVTVPCERYTDDEGYYASFGFKVNELFDTEGNKLKVPMEGKNFTLSIINNIYDNKDEKIKSTLTFRGVFTAKTDNVKHIHDRLFWTPDEQPDKPYDDDYDSELYPDFGKVGDSLLYKVVDYGRMGKLLVKVNIPNETMMQLNIAPLMMEYTSLDTLKIDGDVEAVTLKRNNGAIYTSAQKYDVKFDETTGSMILTEKGGKIDLLKTVVFKDALTQAIGKMPTNYVRINPETTSIYHIILYIPKDLNDIGDSDDHEGPGAYDDVDENFDYQLQGDNYKNLFITEQMEPQTYHRTSCCPIYYSNNGTTADIAQAICNAINSYEYYEQELIATCATGENTIGDTVVIRYRKKDSKHNGIKPEDVRIEIQFDGTFIYRNIITIPTTRFCRLEKIMEVTEDENGNMKWAYVNPKDATEYSDLRYAFRCGSEDSTCLFLVNTSDVKEIANDGGRERFIRTSLKNVYAKILGIVPYLDKNGYVHADKCIMMTDENGKYITTTEFNRIELYENYYPKIGILNFFPIKDFDFDILYSIYGEDWGLSDELKNASEMTTYNPDNSVYVQCYANKYDSDSGEPIEIGEPDIEFKNIISAIDSYIDDEQQEKWENVNMVYARKSTKLDGVEPTATTAGHQGAIIDGYDIIEKNISNSSAIIKGGYYDVHIDKGTTYFSRIETTDVKKILEDGVIEKYNNGLSSSTYKFIDGYKNVIDNEYSYYMEYYMNALSTISKTSPYISKWVYGYGGKDSCENPYRLNISKIFGTNNFSSNLYMDRGEMQSYTHNLPYYLMPKNIMSDSGAPVTIDYPFNSDFYQYIKYGIYEEDYANDVNKVIEIWKDRLANCDINEFNKMFVSDSLDKRHMRKYSIIGGGNYMQDASTMFRGVKFNIIETEKKINKHKEVEYVNKKTGKYNGYKFTFVYIPIFVKTDNLSNTIYFVKNDKCKFICGMMFMNVFGTSVYKDASPSGVYFNLSYIYNILNSDFKKYHNTTISKNVLVKQGNILGEFLKAVPPGRYNKLSQGNTEYDSAFDEYDWDKGPFELTWDDKGDAFPDPNFDLGFGNGSGHGNGGTGSGNGNGSGNGSGGTGSGNGNGNGSGGHNSDFDVNVGGTGSDSGSGSDSDSGPGTNISDVIIWSLSPRMANAISVSSSSGLDDNSRIDYLILGDYKLTDVCTYNIVDNLIIDFKNDGLKLTSLSLKAFFTLLMKRKSEFTRRLGCYIAISGTRLSENDVWSLSQLTFDGDVLRFPSKIILKNMSKKDIEDLTIKFIIFDVRYNLDEPKTNIGILKSILETLNAEYNYTTISNFFNIYSSHYIKDYINSGKNVKYICENYKSDPTDYDFEIYVEEPNQVQTYDVFNGALNSTDKTIDFDMKSSKNIVTLNRYDGSFEPLFRDIIFFNNTPTCDDKFKFSNSSFDEEYEDNVGKFGIIKNLYNHIFNLNEDLTETASNPLSGDFALEYNDFDVFSNIGGYYIDDKLHCIKDEKCMFGTKLMGTPMTIDIHKLKHTDVYNEYGTTSKCELMYNEIGGNTIEFYIYLRNRVLRYFDSLNEIYKTLSYVKDAYEISGENINKNQYKEEIFREFKREYIEKNLMCLYELDSITMWVRSKKVSDRDEHIENNYTSYMEYSEDTLIRKGFSKVNTYKVEVLGGDSFNRKVTYALKKGYKEDFAFTFKIRKI